MVGQFVPKLLRYLLLDANGDEHLQNSKKCNLNPLNLFLNGSRREFCIVHEFIAYATKQKQSASFRNQCTMIETQKVQYTYELTSRWDLKWVLKLTRSFFTLVDPLMPQEIERLQCHRFIGQSEVCLKKMNCEILANSFGLSAIPKQEYDFTEL